MGRRPIRSARYANRNPPKQSAHLVQREDVAGLRRGQVILLAEIGGGEADQVRIQAVEEGDDPGDRDQPDEKPAQPLFFDDRGNIDDGHVRSPIASW